MRYLEAFVAMRLGKLTRFIRLVSSICIKPKGPSRRITGCKGKTRLPSLKAFQENEWNFRSDFLKKKVG